MRLRRRRQDDDRGRAGGDGGDAPRRPVLVLTVDPARRLANALGLEGFGNVERQVPASAFADAGVKPRGEMWAAMLDTRAELGRPGASPRARRQDRRGDPRQLAVPELRRALRAEPRLHRHGASLRDPRDGQLRPRRRRHSADPQCRRLPRRARAHGGLLLEPLPAPAHRAVPVASDEHGEQALLPSGRPHPRHAVPPGHRRVLHPVPDHVRRLRRTRPRRCRRCCATSARRSSSSRPWKPPRSTRPSSSSTHSSIASFTLARSC